MRLIHKIIFASCILLLISGFILLHVTMESEGKFLTFFDTTVPHMVAKDTGFLCLYLGIFGLICLVFSKTREQVVSFVNNESNPIKLHLSSYELSEAILIIRPNEGKFHSRIHIATKNIELDSKETSHSIIQKIGAHEVIVLDLPEKSI